MSRPHIAIFVVASATLAGAFLLPTAPSKPAEPAARYGLTMGPTPSTRPPPRMAPVDAAGDQLAAGTWRIDPSGMTAFYTTTLLDFDHAPDGRRLALGERVEELYRERGVRITSAHETSDVAIDGYVVDSASRGFSAANRAPRWTADLDLWFVQHDRGTTVACTRSQGPARPGCPRVAADVFAPVQAVGVWVAAVALGGTGLAAYDVHGRRVATIYARRAGTDFLGVRSTTPIGSIRVFAVPRVDPNFSIDDVTFAR